MRRNGETGAEAETIGFFREVVMTAESLPFVPPAPTVHTNRFAGLASPLENDAFHSVDLAGLRFR